MEQEKNINEEAELKQDINESEEVSVSDVESVDKNESVKAISIGEWFLSMFIMAIPVIGLVMLFYWAFSSKVKKEKISKSNWAKASLLFILVYFFLIFFAGVVLSLSIQPMH